MLEGIFQGSSQHQDHHPTTNENSRTLLKTTFCFFILYSQQYVSPHCQKGFFEKKSKM